MCGGVPGCIPGDGGSQGLPFGPHAFPSIPQQFRDILKKSIYLTPPPGPTAHPGGGSGKKSVTLKVQEEELAKTTTTNNNEAIFPGLGAPSGPGKVRVPPV